MSGSDSNSAEQDAHGGEPAGESASANSSANSSENSDRLMRVGLIGVAIVSGLAAVWHTVKHGDADKDTALFLGLSAVVLVFHQVGKFEAFGIKMERLRAVVKQEVKPVTERMEVIEDRVEMPGRSRPGAMSNSARTTHRQMRAEVRPESSVSETADTPVKEDLAKDEKTSDDDWDADPNKGQFGGLPERNGRRLEATIKPLYGNRSAACKVLLRVTSTDLNKPLRGKVKVFLHPSFEDDAVYDIKVKGGVAETEIHSWGRFTVGAVADDGETRLELDLNDVTGGTPKFYAN